jgi:hypothetical protein
LAAVCKQFTAAGAWSLAIARSTTHAPPTYNVSYRRTGPDLRIPRYLSRKLRRIMDGSVRPPRIGLFATRVGVNNGHVKFIVSSPMRMVDGKEAPLSDSDRRRLSCGSGRDVRRRLCLSGV